jgi:hypothetical protein
MEEREAQIVPSPRRKKGYLYLPPTMTVRGRISGLKGGR